MRSMQNKFQVNVKNWLLSKIKKHQDSQKLYWNRRHYYYYYYYFFFHWHYSPLRALACRTMSFHFFPMPPSLPIISLPAFEDLFLLPLSIFSSVFPFFSSLPVLEWRSFWASYLPPFSLRDLPAYPLPFIHFTIFSPLFISSSSRFVRLFHSPSSYLGE